MPKLLRDMLALPVRNPGLGITITQYKLQTEKKQRNNSLETYNRKLVEEFIVRLNVEKDETLQQRLVMFMGQVETVG